MTTTIPRTYLLGLNLYASIDRGLLITPGQKKGEEERGSGDDQIRK